MNLDGNDIINIFQSIKVLKRDQLGQRHFKGAYENLLEQLYETCINAVFDSAQENNVWVSIQLSSIQLLLVQASLKAYREKLHFELCEINSNGTACDNIADKVLSVYLTLKKTGSLIQQKEEFDLGVMTASTVL